MPLVGILDSGFCGLASPTTSIDYFSPLTCLSAGTSLTDLVVEFSFLKNESVF